MFRHVLGRERKMEGKCFRAAQRAADRKRASKIRLERGDAMRQEAFGKVSGESRDGKGKRRKGMGLLLAFLLLFGSIVPVGCGGAGSGENADGRVKGNESDGAKKAGSAGGQEEAGEKVMGRYVETMNDSLNGLLMAGSRILEQEDGSLVIFSSYSGRWVSKDQGATWEKDTPEWLADMIERKVYFMDITAAKDGSVGVIYEEAGGEEADSGGAQADDDEGDHAQGVHPNYMVVSPSGEKTEFELPYEPSDYLRRLGFAGDGKLFGVTLGDRIYEIDWQQGESRLVAEVEDGVDYFDVWNGRLICVSGRGVSLYDAVSGEEMPDKALEEFVDNQIGSALNDSDGYYQPLLIIPDGEDTLYLVCEKGIFRHVWGGSLMEQLADGSLNSLSNPSCRIADGIMLENGTFVVIMGGGLVASYAYDPDMPATPKLSLRAYSLRENERLKKAIATYHAEHPEVYIRYEIGMAEGTSVTREDALKKLNTEIAAGNGPDFFLLDDMPVNSYIEKGILADLTPYLEKETGDGYFQNILRAFEKDGKIFAVPTDFKLPFLAGSEEIIGQMEGLASIASAAETYREGNAGGSLFGMAQERALLTKFFMVCAPAWIAEDGTVKEGELEEFFLQMQRIWEAEKRGITEGQRKEEEDYYKGMEQDTEYTKEEIDELWSSAYMLGGNRYMVGEQELFTGIVDGSFDFDVVNSYFRVNGREDGDFGVFGGQVTNVFIPGSIAGISQTSENKQVAGELFQTLAGTDFGGLVLSKEQTKKNLLVNATQDGESYGSMGGKSEEDGTYVYLEIYPATQEQVERLIEMAEQASEPYLKNKVLEEAVCDAGIQVLEGRISVKEAVQEVGKRVSLYMAE